MKISDPRIAVTLLTAVAFAVVDVVWLLRSNLVVDQGLGMFAVKATAAVVLAALGTRFIHYRLRNDEAVIAKFIKRAALSVDIGRRTLTGLAILSVPSVIFMYLATANSRPLQDAELAALDAALGFDWKSFHALVNGPLASTVLIWTYHFLGPQLILIYLLHIARADEGKAMEVNAMTAVSSVFVAVGMALWPAAGAYAHYVAEPGNFTAAAGMWHYDELVALRSGQPFVFSFEKTEGLTTFPSFHTALGIMLTYSVRKWRVLQIAIGIVNALMIVGTLPEGGHHLVDVIAGAAIGVASIVIVRQLVRQEHVAVEDMREFGQLPVNAEESNWR